MNQVNNEAIIGILMGSASDKDVADKVASTLKEFEVKFEVSVISAHRTPDLVTKYSQSAMKRGVKTIIAIAGLSAALPGVVAAHTTVPVIGVPVKGGALDGLDALLSVAQMPPGVPVSAVGLNGGVNAALQAVRILALSNNELLTKLNRYIEKASKNVIESQSKINHPAPPAEAFA